MQMGRRASTVEEVWEQAEEALEASSKRAEGLLTRLATMAEDGSDASLFAHRHLAELHLEDNPWKAALHLKRVLVYCAEDDRPRCVDLPPHLPWYRFPADADPELQ